MLERGIARHGYPVLSDGKVVGEVTSGTKSPTLGKAIALAYIPKKLAKVGQKLEVEIRGKIYAAIVVKRPFYRSKKLKVKSRKCVGCFRRNYLEMIIPQNVKLRRNPLSYEIVCNRLIELKKPL